MEASFLNKLLCPFCGLDFQTDHFETTDDGKEYGVLTCQCNEYPVIADIPIIKFKDSAKGISNKRLVKLIRERKFLEALKSVLVQDSTFKSQNSTLVEKLPNIFPLKTIKNKYRKIQSSKWKNEAGEYVASINKNTNVTDLFDFYFSQTGIKHKNACDYFTYRFGQPRHLAAMSMSTVVKPSEKPILDLGCGFGHMTRGLLKNHHVIGLDNLFFLLFVAKHWIAPDADYVCCEGDQSLPFNDASFSSVMCINSFHFFRNKFTCSREMKRIIDKKGSILLTALHHSKTKTKTRNLALSISGYMNLFADMAHVIIPEDSILDQYLSKRGPSLSDEFSLSDMEKEKLITFIATYEKDNLIDHVSFEEWPHATGRLQLNPLYVAHHSPESEKTQLYRTFPSDFYEEENRLCKSYLPEVVEVERELLEDLDSVGNKADIDRLVSNCVLMDIPENYYSHK